MQNSLNKCKTNPVKKQKSLCFLHIFLAIFKTNTLTLALNRKAIFLLFGLPDVQTSAVAIAPRKKLELAGTSTAELETTTSPLPVNNHPTSPCGRCCRAEVGKSFNLSFWGVFFFLVSPHRGWSGGGSGGSFWPCPLSEPHGHGGTQNPGGSPQPRG